MNPASGENDKAEVRQAIVAALSAAGRPHRIGLEGRGTLEEAARDAALAAQQDGGCVWAVGGDGTINAVANAVLPLGCPMAVIPQGTFNYFARDYGLPEAVDEAIAVALRATPRPVQVGLVNGHAFLVNASVGLYPQLLEDREAWKQRFGRRRFVAVLAGAATLLSWRRGMRLHLQADDAAGFTERSLTLFVGNNRLQLEQMGLRDAARDKEGHLAIVSVKPRGRAAMFRLALEGALGRLGEAEDVSAFAVRSLRVEFGSVAGRAVKVATDGEIRWLRAPLDFGISPQPLQLLKP